MSFDSMMAAAQQAMPIAIEGGWGQGRSSFGGLGAALMLSAMRGELPADAPLRTISNTFIGPLTTGEATASVQLLRAGKSVTHMAAQLEQQGGAQVVSHASFGANRQSSIQWQGTQRIDVPPPERGIKVQYVEGKLPELVKNFDIVALDGGAPYSGHPRPDFSGLMRFKDRSEPLTWEALLASIDAWPFGVMPMLPRMVPVSTMTWSVEFVQTVLPTDPAAWWHYRVHTDAAANGYAHQVSQIRDGNGDLFAISRQVVAIFD